jgi:hypothetical protein
MHCDTFHALHEHISTFAYVVTSLTHFCYLNNNYRLPVLMFVRGSSGGLPNRINRMCNNFVDNLWLRLMMINNLHGFVFFEGESQRMYRRNEA